MADRDERMDLGWDLLDQGEFEGAVRTAEALLSETPDDPEALFLCGTALLEAGRHEEADDRLRTLLNRDPENVPGRLTRAALLYETCRFGEALAEAERALAGGPAGAYGLHLRGLILDMIGRREEADACFDRAAREDPERYGSAHSISPEEFDAAVHEALERLPTPFREKVRNLPIVVRDVPDVALLKSLEDPSPDLLGLFVGTPLPEKSHQDLPHAPDAVYLFKRNLERACSDRAELIEEIEVTLLHEIGHYLGMDEEDLDEAGYA